MIYFCKGGNADSAVHADKSEKMEYLGIILLAAILLPVFGLVVWLLTKGQKRDRSYENRDSTIPPY
jgi:heme/copper-type cytochrome/quinol oxidase subunit 2